MTTYQNWVYTRNPFARALRVSYTRTLQIVSGHKSKLSQFIGDPELDTVYQRIASLCESFEENYALWAASIAERKKCRQDLEEQLAMLSSTLIEDWDIRMQVKHKPATTEYQKLMRGKRGSFQRGSIKARISRVRTLSILLKQYPNLSDLQEEVETFHALVYALRMEQHRWKTKVRQLAATLQRLTPALKKALFQNLCNLVMLYPDEPNMVVSFFDMELIRSKNTSTDDDDLFDFEEDEDELTELFSDLDDDAEIVVPENNETVFSG